MSLIRETPPDVIAGGGHWESRRSGLPFMMALSPSSSSESSRDSDEPHTASPISPLDDGGSYSPSLERAEVPTASTSLRRGSKPGRTPSRYDWTKHMPTIKRLYIDEDKTLNQVLEIMEREHNFVATPRMVKTRLKKWGYSKNVSIKSDEIQTLMDLILQAEALGDVRRTSTEVTLATGRVVGLDRIAAHLRRKKLPSTVVHQAAHLASLISSSSSSSPSSPSSPHSLSIGTASPTSLVITTPDIFRRPESVFFDVRDYVYGYATGIDTPDSLAMVRNTSPEPGKVYSIIYSARDFYVDHKVDEALTTLRLAPAGFKAVIQSNLVAIPRLLFMTIVHLWNIPGAELRGTVKALVRYTIETAYEEAQDLAPEHPLRRILRALSYADEQTLLDIAVRGWKCLLESYDSLPRPSDGARELELPVGAWLDLGHSAGFDSLPVDELEKTLQINYEKKRAQFGECHLDTIRQMFWRAELERQKVDARGISTDHLQEMLETTLRACEGLPPGEAVDQEANCHYNLAHLFKSKNERVRAEYHLRACIEKCIEGHGKEDPSAANFSSLLQGWYKEWKDDAKVVEIQPEIDSKMANLKSKSEE